MGLPIVTIEGGLVADPVLAYSGAGKPWARCRVVAKDRVRDDGGAWVDGDPLFIDVVCFGKPAEHLAESCSKGDTIIVSGKMKERSWQDDSGQERRAMQIHADVIGPSFLWSAWEKKTPVPQTTPGDPWATQAPSGEAPF